MKRMGMRRDAVALIAIAVALLLVAGWLSLPLPTPLGGGASADYVSATRAFDDAVAAGDAGQGGDWVTGNALIELRAQISTDSQESLVLKTTRSPASFELLSGSDGAQFIQVRESGTQHLDVAQAPGNAVIATRERTYSRVVSMTRAGNHYQLSNLSETSAPAGWLDQWGGLLIRALLLASAAGMVLAAMMRYRGAGRPIPQVAARAKVPAVQSLMPDEPVLERSIKCFGGLSIYDHGEDLTPKLLARRVVAFIWMYLLALEIRNPGSRTTRGALADEIFPGLPSQTQRARMRDRLRDIRTDLPESLANCIVQATDGVGFDPTGWVVDALQLRDLPRTASPLSPDVQAGLERRWTGALLQEWEDLERVTEGRGASHEVIGDLRLDMEGRLVDTLLAGVNQLLMLGDAAAAVRIAERARELRPDREDVRNSLTRAYAQAGRHDAADESEGRAM